MARRDEDILDELLGGLEAPAEAVPERVDQAIRQQARFRLTPLRRKHLQRRVASVAAVAAALLLCVWMPWSAKDKAPARHRGEAVADEAVQLREDLDGNGRIDVLDAFQLAREIAAGRTGNGPRDFDGDGQVDDADVEHLASLAVRIGG